VTPNSDLSKLSHAGKDALILSLFARIEALEKRVEELTRPPRTPDDSSTPLDKGHKPSRLPKGKHARKGRPCVAPCAAPRA